MAAAALVLELRSCVPFGKRYTVLSALGHLNVRLVNDDDDDDDDDDAVSSALP